MSVVTRCQGQTSPQHPPLSTKAKCLICRLRRQSSQPAVEKRNASTLLAACPNTTAQLGCAAQSGPVRDWLPGYCSSPCAGPRCRYVFLFGRGGRATCGGSSPG